jgi:ABC-type multidrug transport system fused ATPase/permease subunit
MSHDGAGSLAAIGPRGDYEGVTSSSTAPSSSYYVPPTSLDTSDVPHSSPPRASKDATIRETVNEFPKEPYSEKEAATYGDQAQAPTSQPIGPHRTRTITSQTDALLALPPPPSYDVFVQNLSIAVPPFKAYIPTPIPIPIPDKITGLFRKKHDDTNSNPLADAADGLIVRNVTATIRQGEMCAIIGGSGSGKTTLLHAIASRLGNLPIASGEVLITPSEGTSGVDTTGGHVKVKGLTKAIGFVRQNDFLLPHLTGLSLAYREVDTMLTFIMQYARRWYTQPSFDFHHPWIMRQGN